jgi:hypothetical protein
MISGFVAPDCLFPLHIVLPYWDFGNSKISFLMMLCGTFQSGLKNNILHGRAKNHGFIQGLAHHNFRL